MVNKKYQKSKLLSFSIQKYNIKKKFKNIVIKDFSKRYIKMLLGLKPNENSKIYYVLIEYKSLKKSPQVFVSLNQLNVTKKEDIPHKYQIKKIGSEEYVNLCLYYGNEWKSNMNISDTIIPWTCEWLYFFEIWTITGKWCGGGKHPIKKDIKQNNKN